MFPALGYDFSGVADLAAHLCIERSAVEDQLEHSLVLLLHGALFQETAALELKCVVTDEFGLLAFMEYGPVPEFVGGSIAGPFLLLEKLCVEAFHIHGIAVLRSDKLGKVDRESVGVVQDEGIHSRDGLGRGVLGDIFVHQPDSAVQGPQE